MRNKFEDLVIEPAEKEQVTYKEVEEVVDTKKDLFEDLLAPTHISNNEELEFMSVEQIRDVIEQVILPNEQVYYHLKSSKLELVFTNQSIIILEKTKLVSSKLNLSRRDYCYYELQDLALEISGTTERKMTLKLTIGDAEQNWTFKHTQNNELTKLYCVLTKISRMQKQQVINLKQTQDSVMAASQAVGGAVSEEYKLEYAFDKMYESINKKFNKVNNLDFSKAFKND